MLFISILLSIPEQSNPVLGIELVVLALVAAAAQVVLDRRAQIEADTHDVGAHATAAILDSVAPTAITTVLLAVAGLLLALGVHAGLDVLVVLVGLAGGVVSAWLLLTKPSEASAETGGDGHTPA